MTEAEWVSCDDPYALMRAAQPITQRKGKLFVVGCCRQHSNVLRNRLNRRAIRAIEDNADGKLTGQELRERAGRGVIGYRLATACSAVPADPMFVILTEHLVLDPDANRAVQCHLLRDIFGSPFRLVALNANWRTADVLGLARAIYDERAFDRLPILADALQDAGCDDEPLLGHCRGRGPHVRGCGAVDLVLGRE
jgi:hypothetical protein